MSVEVVTSGSLSGSVILRIALVLNEKDRDGGDDDKRAEDQEEPLQTVVSPSEKNHDESGDADDDALDESQVLLHRG